MSKEELIEIIKKWDNTQPITRNSMGCNENWYCASFAIKETFSLEEIEQMTELEVEHLIKLADNIAEALY